VRERLGIRHQVVARPHAAAREVETHGGEATVGEQMGEMGKESPLHEALEAMADDDRGARSGLRRQVDEAVQRAAGGQVEAKRAAVGHGGGF
jgi:hypothetical protein